MDKHFLDPGYKDKYWSLVEQNIFHHYDYRTVQSNLENLYGLVALRQNCILVEAISGHRILDVGAGFGTFLRLLRDNGLEAVGVDINFVKMRYAKDRYQLDILPADVHAMPFKDNHFDTVILREVVAHLDFESALPEIERICGKEIIIFEPNTIPLLRLGRWIVGHTERNEKSIGYFQHLLEQLGYKTTVSYTDTLALGLSGGLITTQKIPRWGILYDIVMRLDELVYRVAKLLHLEKLICWRYLLHATKHA